MVGKNKIKIAPSLLSADFGNLNFQLELVKNADYIHFDVMDGHFVPNLTVGAVVLKNLRTKLIKDVHLMIENPEKFIDDFAKAGAGIITVHAEVFKNSEELENVIDKIKGLGIKAGVSVSPPTSWKIFEKVLDKVDMVLIMSVNPGFGGQKFIPEVLTKVREIREIKPELDIEMDGGISIENVSECVNAGANVIVVGSAVFGDKNPTESVKLIREKAETAK